MIKIYFVCQHPSTKQKVVGQPIFFPELTEHAHAQIQANYMSLSINLPGWTVLAVIGNEEIV